ncbi:hypothetical protein C8R46DRAFT_923377 [Mycena filopes]|nr:hypothetical protein C8R46DRAFT_923377 [Mycena filopes]
MKEEFGEEEAGDWYPSVVRWARARLPNGQIARSLRKEERMSELRTARHVKVDEGCDIAEVLFFFILKVEEEERFVAMLSFFAPPDPHLLDISSQTYWSAQHLRDADIRVVDVSTIASCVMMAPDAQYRLYKTDGSDWFLMEKPGLKLALWTGSEDVEDDDG